ncbi:MAG: hypothetical protein PHU03_04610 [Syntrophales bacterium]|nr:hypothetical protein [Syntrophales bacterium]
MNREDDKAAHSVDDSFIDGGMREYGAVNKPDQVEIVDLVDMIDDEGIEQRIPCNEEITDIIVKTTERMVREMFPHVAERVIREEIEKLKNDLDP